MYDKIFYKDLSYKLQGVLFDVRKELGPGLKEIIYCNEIEEHFKHLGLPYIRECSISVFSPLSGKVIGHYRPDFVIDDKIILEIKSVDIIPKNFIDQIFSYLKISKYELGLFVNFKSPNLFIKRIVYTNDRKKQFVNFV